jgi:DNA-binding response OmpR family regulator
MTDLFAMIIEDEDDQSDIFREALRAAGYRTEICRTGSAAQIRLGEVVPHIIILDLHLPGVDGTHLLAQIRADARLAKSKVLVASADHAMADALPLRPDLVLLKPVSFGQLRDLSIRFKKAFEG